MFVLFIGGALGNWDYSPDCALYGKSSQCLSEVSYTNLWYTTIKTATHQYILAPPYNLTYSLRMGSLIFPNEPNPQIIQVQTINLITTNHQYSLFLILVYLTYPNSILMLIILCYLGCLKVSEAYLESVYCWLVWTYCYCCWEGSGVWEWLPITV